MYIRKGNDKKAELVLLDHGLYDYLQPADRVNLCQLYKSIILRDEEGMINFSKNLGVDGEYTFIIHFYQCVIIIIAI